uniref:Uncharacterized protein n=3 Tax=Oryza sativa subsp. japonica TaxID=39947 RepID=Q75GD0_ORYSJ|nr:hypothetical protein [Oryza sativa Japonica Group]ABF96652.1 hypothetical protein LOC_Os03g30600 [Oryza sativa Japonica Group]
MARRSARVVWWLGRRHATCRLRLATRLMAFNRKSERVDPTGCFGGVNDKDSTRSGRGNTHHKEEIEKDIASDTEGKLQQRDTTGLQQSNQTNQSNEEIGHDFLGSGGLGDELRAVGARLGVVVVQVPASSTRASSRRRWRIPAAGVGCSCVGVRLHGRRHPHRREAHGGSGSGVFIGGGPREVAQGETSSCARQHLLDGQRRREPKRHLWWQRGGEVRRGGSGARGRQESAAQQGRDRR